MILAMTERFQRPQYYLLVSGILWIVVTAVPPPTPLEMPNARSNGTIWGGYDNQAFEEVWRGHARYKRQNIDKYKYYYVTQCGVHREKPQDMKFVEVAATIEALDIAHEKAARLVFKTVRFMPMEFFQHVTEYSNVGVFARDQVIGDFEEYANTKSGPGCEKSCKNKCRPSCYSGNRKYDSLVGYSKSRAVVREDNILCGKDDPYNGNLNVLSHEFAHSIHIESVGQHDEWHELLEKAYVQRYDHWGRGYATSDMKEFFAEATTSYFRTSLLGNQSAEMNYCGDPKKREYCLDEWNSRENLKSKDPTLFRLVDEVYTGSRAFLESRLGVCDW